MPPVISSSSSDCILRQRDNEPFPFTGSHDENKFQNGHNNGKGGNSGVVHKSNISNTNHNGGSDDDNDNSNNNGNFGGGGANSSQNRPPTSNIGPSTKIASSASIKSPPTSIVISTITSTGSTSTSPMPASTFLPSTSSDHRPTSTPSLSSSSTSTSHPVSTPLPVSTIGSPSANDALGVSGPSGDIRGVLPLGSIVAIILGILFCITIGLVIYVVTRPRFGSLGRLWKSSTVKAPTIASFETKGYSYRPSDRYVPNEYSRSISRSQLLDNFQFPAPSSEGAHSSISHISRVVEPISPPPASPEFQDDYPTQSYVVPSPTSVPETRLSSSGAAVPRVPSPNYRSITRILSILEGYPFENEEQGPASDNARHYPHSVHGTVE